MYALSAAALRQAEELGIKSEELQKMARASAPVTHDLGSHRYENFVLSIDDDDTVFGIWNIAAELNDRILRAECPMCEPTAINCNHCNGTHEVIGSAETLISILEEAAN